MAITITSAALNGATKVIIVPGGAITGGIVADVDGGTTWFTSGWLIDTTPPGATTCADTTDRVGPLVSATSGNIAMTAPAVEGAYDAYFVAYDAAVCGGTPSATWTMASPSLGVVVNIRPVITSVTPPANGNYVTDQTLDFTVNYDQNVTKAGATPGVRINIVIGSTTRQANYVSGSGTTALLFQYTVVAGDLDSNGITFLSPTVSLASGTLRDTTYAAYSDTAAQAVLAFTAPNTSGVRVNSATLVRPWGALWGQADRWNDTNAAAQTPRGEWLIDE